MIIYKATNRINGKAYVGQTVFSLKNRRDRHVSETLNGKDNNYFHNAIRKYGIKKFDWKILQECDTIEELNRLEVHYIKLYDTFNNGYNLTKGGEGKVGYVPSKETRKKISEFRTGMKLSEKTKRKISEGNKGKKHHMWGKKRLEETKRKISEALKGENNYWYGKHLSEETKKKVSENRKGKSVGKDSPKAKPVIINNKYFDTKKEAAEYLNISFATVGNRIKRQVPGYQYV